MDRYVLGRVLGKGTYGTVYLASRGSFMYAIKEVSMLNPIETLWEISLFNLMSHPNIASPFEYFPSPDHNSIFIVMPEAEGTLDSRIGNELTQSDIRLITWQILSALDYLHANHIIHRDLKPSNILLDDMRVTIIDFGLARFLNQGIDMTSTNVQTYTYRAPEVYRSRHDPSGQYHLGAPMDMWSLGMIMLEMFLGHRYFASSNRRFSEVEVAEYLLGRGMDIIYHDIRSLNIPPDAKNLLFALLHPDPQRRISARQAMANKWFSGMRYQPPEGIRYPIVRINPQSDTVSQIRQDVNELMIRCGFSDAVFNLMIKLVGEAYRNYPDTFTNPDTRIRYYNILLKIAAFQISEYKFENVNGCTLTGRDGVRDIYSIFEALRFNIIVI